MARGVARITPRIALVMRIIEREVQERLRQDYGKDMPKAVFYNGDFKFTADPDGIHIHVTVRHAFVGYGKFEEHIGHSRPDDTEFFLDYGKYEGVMVLVRRAARINPNNPNTIKRIVPSVRIGPSQKKDEGSHQQRKGSKFESDPTLDSPFDALAFSIRTYNCLNDSGKFKTIRDVTEKTAGELLELDNFGRKCLTEVREVLRVQGFHLKGEG